MTPRLFGAKLQILSNVSQFPLIFLHLGQFTCIRIFFESATFSFRIRLPSTRIRCIRHKNPQLFDSTLQRGNFWIRYESRIAWTLNPENVQWIIKTVPTVMLGILSTRTGEEDDALPEVKSRISIAVRMRIGCIIPSCPRLRREVRSFDVVHRT